MFVTSRRSVSARRKSARRGATALITAVAASASVVVCGTAVAQAAKPAERLAPCKAPVYDKSEAGLNKIAARSFVKEYGGTITEANRWLDVQAAALDLPDLIRASTARKDFMDMSFGNKHKRTNIFMRNHRHDAAIRRCAREMGINSYVHIGIHRWSEADLVRGIRQLSAALDGSAFAGVYETYTSGGDYFNIDVYLPTTEEQYQQIVDAAKRTGVGYRLKRINAEAPVSEPL